MATAEHRELLDQIGLKLRIGKLDSMFLLIPTLLGITSSFVQYFLGVIGNRAAMVDFVPVLITGIIFPVWIGYYRGGIKLDSITERARGWIYLFGGTLACAVYLFSKYGIEFIPVTYRSWILLLAIAIMSMLPLISVPMGSRIMSLFGKTPNALEKRAFRGTSLAALLLSGTFLAAADIHVFPLLTATEFDYLRRLSTVLVCSILGLLAELRARERLLGATRTRWGSIGILSVLLNWYVHMGFIPQKLEEQSAAVSDLLLLGISSTIISAILGFTSLRKGFKSDRRQKSIQVTLA